MINPAETLPDAHTPDLTITLYPEVSLKEARAARDKARQQLAEHIDPSMQKQIDQLVKHQESDNSFKRVALEWFETKMADKSEKHRKRTISAIERDLFPYIGKRPISDIKAIELLTVLKKIISDRQAVETAHRVMQQSGSGRTTGNDPASPAFFTRKNAFESLFSVRFSTLVLIRVFPSR